jgi:hypothetical protein
MLLPSALPLSLGRRQRWSQLSQGLHARPSDDSAEPREECFWLTRSGVTSCDVILLLDMLVFKNYFCGALCLEPLTFGEVMC